MIIKAKPYLNYRLLSSLFAGMAMGAIFVVYSGISPSIFSAGGILMAIGGYILAKLYKKILNLRTFFVITLFTEALTLLTVLLVLLFEKSSTIATLYYAFYQIVFLFGTYIMRAESMFLRKQTILSFLDARKQIGYIGGLILSYGCYETFKRLDYLDPIIQAKLIHYPLFLIQLGTILFLIKSFRKKRV